MLLAVAVETWELVGATVVTVLFPTVTLMWWVSFGNCVPATTATTVRIRYFVLD